MSYTASRDQFTISTDKALLNHETIAAFMGQAYWAKGRSRERIERSLENSICFGIYEGDKQVGFARVITDCAVFAYLCDVFIDEAYRGHGLGKWLMTVILAHPDLQGLRRWTLATRDAHGLYQQFGFSPLNNPTTWMEMFNPYPGEERA